MCSKSKLVKNHPSEKFEKTSKPEHIENYSPEELEKNAKLECIKNYLSEEIKNTRSRLDLTQAQMAEKLAISTRAYSDIEGGESCCSILTFLYFLTKCSQNDQNDMALLKDLKGIIESTD